MNAKVWSLDLEWLNRIFSDSCSYYKRRTFRNEEVHETERFNSAKRIGFFAHLLRFNWSPTKDYSRHAVPIVRSTHTRGLYWLETHDLLMS